MSDGRDPEILDALEPDQRAAALERPIQPRRLSPGVIVLLWALRIYALAAVVLVIYAFVRSLTAP